MVRDFFVSASVATLSIALAIEYINKAFRWKKNKVYATLYNQFGVIRIAQNFRL